jgi:hypothetical protein
MRLVGVLVVTPNEDDFAPILADTNPSAASPRLSSSHTADALLGIRFLKRKSSRARNSSASSMICRRSGRTLSSGLLGRVLINPAWSARFAECPLRPESD